VYASILTTSTGGLPPADHTAPVTTLIGADGQWHADAQQLSLSAVDGPDGSGVASTAYRVDGGEWKSGTLVTVGAPDDHSKDGVHTVEYYSTDGAGNAESHHTGRVRIDTLAPTTVLSGVVAGWQPGPVRATLTPGDGDGSGIAEAQYRLDGGDWAAGTHVSVGGDGAHTLGYRAVDLAGNVGSTRSVTVRVDSTGPVTAATQAAGVHGRRILLQYQVTDALSRRATHVRVVVRDRKGAVVKRFALTRVSMEVWHSVAWTPLARGRYRYTVFARDEAGNVQSSAGSAKVVVR